MANTKKDLTQEIGKRLSKVRKSAGFTQQQFGKVIGCGRANYSRIENGDVSPNPLMLLKLKERFEVNINYIVTGQGEEYLKETKESSDVLEIPAGYRFDKDDRELIDYFCQSSIVRNSLKAYFRILFLKESETIHIDIEDLSNSGTI